ncbi:MAG: replication initiation protein RepC [Shimia sp.]
MTDKWALLDAVTEGAALLGVSHRAVNVLRALLSFHPKRVLPLGLGEAIVFPSNATLGSRLGGMPESTLRRHLSALITAGLIVRRDSPNRKRYRRRSSAEAYGFDIGQLALSAARVNRAAAQARALAAEIADLRATLQDHCRRIGAGAADYLRLLRRKLSADALRALVTEAAARGSSTTEMSGSDSENERHIDSENKTYSSLPHDLIERLDGIQRALTGRVLCNEHDLHSVADTLAPMTGIRHATWTRSKTQWGPTVASAVGLCLVDRLAMLENADAYLQTMLRWSRDRVVSWLGLGDERIVS